MDVLAQIQEFTVVPDSVWNSLLIQFPIAAALLIALWRGWIRIGSVEDKQEAKELQAALKREKEKAIEDAAREKERAEALARERQLVEDRLAFMEGLRQAAIEERGKLEDRLEHFSISLREATDIMARSVDLNERIVDDLQRDPTLRTRSGDGRSEEDQEGVVGRRGDGDQTGTGSPRVSSPARRRSPRGSRGLDPKGPS